MPSANKTAQVADVIVRKCILAAETAISIESKPSLERNRQKIIIF